MGTGNNVVKNNISLQKTYGLGPYIAMQGFTFAHNYSEAAFPFSFNCAEAKGEYRETFEKFAITDNVFNTTGGCVDYRGNIVGVVVDARNGQILQVFGPRYRGRRAVQHRRQRVSGNPVVASRADAGETAGG